MFTFEPAPTSEIWDKLITCQDRIIKIFDDFGEEFEEPGLDYFNRDDGSWINRVWKNKDVRRAHIDVVDARASKGLWMMHVCCFPDIHNDGPIYGFDVIAGKNKITGAFHDFSPTSNLEHEMIQGYYDSVEDFVPKKQRELPEWAKNIFTEKMLAASNVKADEVDRIIDIALTNLCEYFNQISESAGAGDRDHVVAAQNYYCHNQQQNPHTPNVMKSLGLDEADVEKFCTDMLFPKIA
jgi:phycocyanobilin:ferredoxin oxidoreductase